MNICKRQTSQTLLSRFYFRTFQVLMVFLLLFRGFCIQLSFRDITSCIHEGLVKSAGSGVVEWPKRDRSLKKAPWRNPRSEQPEELAAVDAAQDYQISNHVQTVAKCLASHYIASQETRHFGGNGLSLSEDIARVLTHRPTKMALTCAQSISRLTASLLVHKTAFQTSIKMESESCIEEQFPRFLIHRKKKINSYPQEIDEW